MPFQVIDTTDARFEGIYAQYVGEAESATFWYLPRWRQYQASYCAEAFVADRSFVVMDGDQAVAACPIIIEQEDGVNRVAIRNSFDVGPLVAPGLVRRHRRKVEDASFEVIEGIARTYDVAKIMMSMPFNGVPALSSPFPEQRYFDAAAFTHATDLSLSTQALWAEVRGSYHSIINKARRRLRVVVVDANSPSYDLHTAYRLLHHKAAGRVTRPTLTFELQYRMLTENNAALVVLLDGETPVACTYFHHHRGLAYLASIADDHDFDAGIPLEHLVIWTATEYYKARGFRFLELGYQQYGPQIFETSSPKEAAISFFKRGFAGRSYYVPRGVRYYDERSAIRELSGAVAAMCDAVRAESHQEASPAMDVSAMIS